MNTLYDTDFVFGARVCMLRHTCGVSDWSVLQSFQQHQVEREAFFHFKHFNNVDTRTYVHTRAHTRVRYESRIHMVIEISV